MVFQFFCLFSPLERGQVLIEKALSGYQKHRVLTLTTTAKLRNFDPKAHIFTLRVDLNKYNEAKLAQKHVSAQH